MAPAPSFRLVVAAAPFRRPSGSVCLGCRRLYFTGGGWFSPCGLRRVALLSRPRRGSPPASSLGPGSPPVPSSPAASFVAAPRRFAAGATGRAVGFGARFAPRLRLQALRSPSRLSLFSASPSGGRVPVRSPLGGSRPVPLFPPPAAHCPFRGGSRLPAARPPPLGGSRRLSRRAARGYPTVRPRDGGGYSYHSHARPPPRAG